MAKYLAEKIIFTKCKRKHDQNTLEQVWYEFQPNRHLSLRDFAYNGLNILIWFLSQ
jgi:hypothetical protein